jgi:hypothetical protein
VPKARSFVANVLTSGGGGGGDFVTSFPTIEAPLSQGGIWQCGLQVGQDWTDPKVTANGCVATSAPTPNRYSDDIAFINPAARVYTRKQRALAVLYKAAAYTAGGGAHECELFLLGNISAHSVTGYECSMGIDTTGTYFFVVRWEGAAGTYTPLWDPHGGIGSYLNTPSALADGDTWEAKIDNSGVILLKQNGVSIGTVTDTTYTSGQPGLGFWPVDGATPANMGWKSYTAGDW